MNNPMKKIHSFLLKSSMAMALLAICGSLAAQTTYNLVDLGFSKAYIAPVIENGAQLMLYQPGDNNNRTSWLTLESQDSGAKLKLITGATDGTNPMAEADVTAYVFTVRQINEDTIALRASNGEYISSAITSSTKDNITTSRSQRALFKVIKTGNQFYFKRADVQSDLYLNTQANPYVNYWSGAGDWSKWEVYTPSLEEILPDTLTMSTLTGTLTRDGQTSTWNSLWTSSSDESEATITLRASANNMATTSDGSGYIDLRSGSVQSSTYTITVPDEYEILSYTIRCKVASSQQTLTPSGGTERVFTNTDTVVAYTVNVGNGAHQAVFTLAGGNTGLLSKIDVVYKEMSVRDVEYKVVFKGDTVAVETAQMGVGEQASVPASLDMGSFATFSYDPAKIDANTDEVVATMHWSPNAPIQFSDALNDTTHYYKLRITNGARTVYFNYTPNASMSNIACDPADSLDNGLWAFFGNPYAARVVNKAAGNGLRLASPITSSSTPNTGLATYAVLTNDLNTYPDSVWRILPATQTSGGANLTTGGFYLRNMQGHCLNIRNASGSSVYHLAYWTTGYDAGSAFLSTTAANEPWIGSTVQGFWTTGRSTETWLTRTIVNAADIKDGGTVSSLTARLKDNTAALVDNVRLYAVNNDTMDFYILKNPEIYQVGDTKSGDLSGDLTFDFGEKAVTFLRGQKLKLFLTATVKADAPLNQTVDAQVTSVTLNGEALTPTDGDPNGQAKIFQTWAPVFHWKNHGYAVWRIPAMARTYNPANGNSQRLVAVIDGTNDGFQQGNNWNPNPDPGYAPINVFYAISDDNGRTWTDPKTLKLSSRTTGSNTYSFGDPAIVRCKSGKLLVLTCATDKTFWGGQTSPYMFTSTDNGETFDAGHTINNTSILTDEVANTQGFGGYSWFVTSGRGICTTSGRVMFLVNYIKAGQSGTVANTRNYVLYSDDEGEHWTISGNVVWDGYGNESKLCQLPNGKILASIRRGGNRGFNLSTDSTGTTWTSQRTPAEAAGGIHDAGVNADVIAYGDSLLIHTIIRNNGSGSTRTDLEVFVSANQGQTWTRKFQIQPTYCGYSTMEILDNGDLAILFEDGSYHYGDNQYDTEIIHYYDITCLTIPADTIATWGKVRGQVDPLKRLGVLDENGQYTAIHSATVNPDAAATDPNASGNASIVLSSRRYNILGQPVDADYKGIVIQNGKKVLKK